MLTSPVPLLVSLQSAVAERLAHAVSGLLCRAEDVRCRAHLILLC